MIKHLWAVSAAALLLAACSNGAADGAGSGKASSAHTEESLKEMTVDEVDAKLAAKDGKFFVFDNNAKEVYEKGHVPGAKWVDHDAVKASDLPSDKDATLVFYCANEH